MPVLVNGNVHVIVNVLDLRDFDVPLHFLHHWHMNLLNDWDINNLVNDLDLRNLLGHVHNVIVDDWPLSLNGLVDNLRLLYFDSLDLMIMCRM